MAAISKFSEMFFFCDCPFKRQAGQLCYLIIPGFVKTFCFTSLDYYFLFQFQNYVLIRVFSWNDKKIFEAYLEKKFKIIHEHMIVCQN